MVDWRQLIFWVDDWRDTDPGQIKGQPLILVGVQKERRIRKLWKKSIKNWIYAIDGSKMIVYKEYPLSPAVMKMGLSGHFLNKSGNPMHRYAVDMDYYYDVFVHNLFDIDNIEWRERNNYELVLDSFE